MLGSCWSCGDVGAVQQHHVVPKALGGRRTVPLCVKCHAKVHSDALGNLSPLVLSAQVRRGERDVGVVQDAVDAFFQGGGPILSSGPYFERGYRSDRPWIVDHGCREGTRAVVFRGVLEDCISCARKLSEMAKKEAQDFYKDAYQEHRVTTPRVWYLGPRDGWWSLHMLSESPRGHRRLPVVGLPVVTNVHEGFFVSWWRDAPQVFASEGGVLWDGRRRKRIALSEL